MSDLLKLIERKHPNELMSACSQPANDSQCDLSKRVYCPKVISIHEYLCDTIRCFLRPFSVVHNDKVRMNNRYDELSLNTSKIYMSRLTTRVEANTFCMLLDKIAFDFDGQTTLEASYLQRSQLTAVFDIDWLS